MMNGQNNISLVPEYGSSSSESESESESKTQSSHLSNGNREQPQSVLGTKLSSILPPPNNKVGGKKIKIVVNLPQSDTAQTEPSVENQSSTSSHSRQDNSDSAKGTKAHSGSVFSDLSSILPAPKNSRKVLGDPAAQLIKDHTGTSEEPDRIQRSILVPHSLTNRQKGKTADRRSNSSNSTISQKTDTLITQSSLIEKKSKVDDTDGDDEHLNLQESGSFFTIGESEQAILQRELDANTNSTDVDPDSADHIIATKDQTGEIEMYYDPNSGYYYDHTSGLYYYYDPDSSQYIDARSLYQDQNDRHMTEVRSDVHARENPSLGSNIDKADIEKLIGRSAFKRGEASAMIGMAVKDLSHRSQLAGSDYSDAKSGAEFAAKRAAESRRRATHTIIEGDAVGKKKKQKHNIMYLALQAQEQESELKEAHANRKNARKAARSKYGM